MPFPVFSPNTPLANGYELVTMGEERIGEAASIMVGAEPWRSYGYSRERIEDYLAGSVSAGVARAVTHGDETAGLVVVIPAFLGGRFIETLALAETHRRCGLGRSVIHAVGAELPVYMRDLFVMADEENTGAVLFYRRLGFVDVGPLRGRVLPERTELLLWWRYR